MKEVIDILKESSDDGPKVKTSQLEECGSGGITRNVS